MVLRRNFSRLSMLKNVEAKKAIIGVSTICSMSIVSLTMTPIGLTILVATRLMATIDHDIGVVPTLKHFGAELVPTCTCLSCFDGISQNPIIKTCQNEHMMIQFGGRGRLSKE